MKFLRDLKTKLANSNLIMKLKKIKNLELVIAAILAIIAITTYVVITVKGKNKAETTTTATVEMNQQEARIAEMISEIEGVGKARVLITTGEDNGVVGVVVVAEGADQMGNRIKMIRLVEKATGATVDRIEIFEMVKGG